VILSRSFKKENFIPANIPKYPDRVFKRTNEWRGWADFPGKDD